MFIDIKTYEKLEKIGEGSFSKVYKVLNKKDGKLYSAKISIHENLSFDKEIRNLLREVKIMSLLYFPSITKFYGFFPNSFKNKPKQTIITEYNSNDSLYSLFQLIRKGKTIQEWTDTKKLINIYGIARALEYLHEHQILHRDLKPSNILLNDYLFPKISDFGLSKIMDQTNFLNFEFTTGANSNSSKKSDKVPNTPEYLAPEVIKEELFSKSSDVYAFAMIVYEIVTDEKPFSNMGNIYKILKEIASNGRPKFNKQIPDCYRMLIESCWSSEPEKRPSFSDIVKNLEKNPDFITENVNADEYFAYIQYINLSSEGNNDFDLDKYYQKVDIYKNRIKGTKNKNIYIDAKSIDLNLYEKKEQLGKGSFGTVYKIIEKESGDIYAAKISIKKLYKCTEDQIINLEREVNIVSKLNYPSILKFIGFSSINFKYKQKPTIITEYASNGSLDEIIELERNSISNSDWDDTKKLINIYGIAAGMSYLHSLNILHRDLKPGNILLDKYLFPKISDFGLSKILNSESAESRQIKSGYKGTPAYSAPEAFNEIYTKASDVFSYSVIVYEIMTNEIPYSKMNQYQLLTNVCAGYRPSFKHPIPYSYQKLIEDCWSDDPNKRPTFNEIILRLQEDKGFITPTIDEEEFFNYVSFIDETFDNKITSAKEFHEVSVDLNQKKDEQNKNIPMTEYFLDLSKFEKGKLIMKSEIYKSYEVKFKETDSIFLCKISMIKIDNFSRIELIKLLHEVNIISQLKHPCFLRFIGYSPINFKQQPNPVIITELPSKGSLFNFLEKERNKRKVLNWNDTKKLIIIYGIASGMSYLHLNKIVHRDLNPKNIYLDENFYPKLGDFGLSVRKHNIDTMTYQSMSGMKGSPIYSSPEILKYNDYSNSSDVYAFSMIVYEIITKKVPFNELKNTNEIFNEVVIKNQRPKINEKIPNCYRQLIEMCWAQNKDERPTFDDIIHILKTNVEFITDKTDKEEYYNYIEFIEDNKQLVNKANKKILQLDNLIKEKSKIQEVPEKEKNELENSSSDDENEPLHGNSEDNDADEKNTINQNNNSNENKTSISSSIQEFISSNKPKELFEFLINNKINNDEISSVFDQCFCESIEFYVELCREGLLHNNAVAHHKYALYLIFNQKANKEDFKEVLHHFEESINQGFYKSYFSLSRLYHEVFHNDIAAINLAIKGSKLEEKSCKCLLGHFISKGIGTKKNFHKGIQMMIQSGDESCCEIFATDIGLYYSQIYNLSNEFDKKAFEFFEKAYKMKKTKATINNYGLCYLRGFGVNRNIEKAIEIFKDGVSIGDINSKYHLSFIFEHINNDFHY